MPVDSFRYLPRIIAFYYRMTERQPELPIPWTPLPRPLSECTFGLVTTGGLYHQSAEAPFDIEREKREPTWGDPTYRIIPTDIAQTELGASHLHYDTHDVLEDMDILLPMHRFQELLLRRRIGGLAPHGYSFMGYQGFPADAAAWQATYGPEVARKLKAEGVQCVLLTPA